MEDLIVNAKEHRLLRKFKKKLEQRYNVEIRMPCATSLDSDVIFVSIQGEKSNRDSVKNFLSEKKKKSCQNAVNEGIVTITLSDSEEERSSGDCEEADTMKTSSSCTSPNFENILSFHKWQTDSVCIIDTSPNKGNTLEISDHQTKGKTRKRMQKEKVRKKAKLNESVILLEDPIIKTDSTIDCSRLHKENNSINEKSKSSKNDIVKATSAMIESDIDFIPLTKMSKCQNRMSEDCIKDSHINSSKQKKEDNDDIVIIVDEPDVTPGPLRPIVIDGSNVAFAHGKSNVFSGKGIQIAVDYFLKRGHTQITAFVPKFRRNPNPNRTKPTTDASILDELEKKQHVVFTPSRKLLNGKSITSYDDRFIVQLAASNGGVIVSNDNYRDLVNESDSFKEAIEQRLLMFCFVGDVFMVPEDPLGRNGPKLDDYLRFPPESKKDKS